MGRVYASPIVATVADEKVCGAATVRPTEGHAMSQLLSKDAVSVTIYAPAPFVAAFCGVNYSRIEDRPVSDRARLGARPCFLIPEKLPGAPHRVGLIALARPSGLALSALNHAPDPGAGTATPPSHRI
jgi:hypothetical protein